jgi:hypothetical protein
MFSSQPSERSAFENMVEKAPGMSPINDEANEESARMSRRA